MKTKSIVLVAALFGLLVMYWLAARSQTWLASEAQAAKREGVAEEANILVATERLDAALEQLAAAEKEIAFLKQMAARPTRSRSSAPPPHRPTIDERLRTEPDVQVLWLKLQRERMMATYGPLFRSLGLTTEQISRFKDNVIRKQEQQMDLKGISTEEKKSTGSISVETTEMFKRVDQEYLTAQRALLGDAAFQEVEDYERTMQGKRTTLT